jgi:hypothetical protein
MRMAAIKPSERFHLADFVHKIDTSIRIGAKQPGRLVQRRDVNAVFADAGGFGKINMCDDAPRPVEAHQAKAASFPALANFFGVEATQTPAAKPGGGASDHRRLADAGRAGDEQDVSLVVAVLGHRRLSVRNHVACYPAQLERSAYETADCFKPLLAFGSAHSGNYPVEIEMPHHFDPAKFQ